MKKLKLTLLLFSILVNSIFTTGCWNYREVDKMAIVAGVAIDKGIKDQFQMTVEIIQISSGRDAKMTSKIITAEGKTMFDAARNIISLIGKRLYWSHAKVIILSKEIASEGVNNAIEWYFRDSETREDIALLISEAVSAKEIFESQGTTEDIKSFTLGDMKRNLKSLSKAPEIDALQYSIESQTKGMSAIIPAVNVKQMNGKMLPQISGTAIIKNGKLVGFLNGEETKDLLFIRNEVKGGLLIEEMQSNDVPTLVSLEIFKNKTKVTPVVADNDIEININIDAKVTIGEISGTENVIDDEGRRKLEQRVDNRLKERIEALVEKVQSKYDADIFGFAARLQENNVQVWDSVGNDWEEVFKDLNVNVTTKVHIKSSSILSKSFEKGN